MNLDNEDRAFCRAVVNVRPVMNNLYRPLQRLEKVAVEMGLSEVAESIRAILSDDLSDAIFRICRSAGSDFDCEAPDDEEVKLSI